MTNGWATRIHGGDSRLDFSNGDVARMNLDSGGGCPFGYLDEPGRYIQVPKRHESSCRLCNISMGVEIDSYYFCHGMPAYFL